jgi:hypothetical protein
LSLFILCRYRKEGSMACETSEAYAEDVTDLREAQRIIAALRRVIDEMSEHMKRASDEYWVILDAEYSRMLQLLYQQGKLTIEQDPEWELDEAFEEFVKEALDVHWDMARAQNEGQPNLFRRITPSA